MPDRRPAPDETSAYARRYVALVPDGPVRETLARQAGATAALVAPADADHAYAPGKWTVRQVVQHLADAERLFAARALRVARGDRSPLVPFSEDDFAAATAADRRPLGAVVDELRAVRAATLALLDGLPAEAWDRRGVGPDGHPVTVRGIVWTVAGHERHHAALFRDRYGL